MTTMTTHRDAGGWIVATEIRRERVLGNFRPSPTERAKVKSKAPAERRASRDGNSQKHLACIRQLPCVCCGKFDTRSDPHHLLTGTGTRGVGMKSTDRWVLPVCRTHHDDLHRLGSSKEVRFFYAFGIRTLDLASALWGATGDVPKMTSIILAHRGEGKT